MNKSFNIEDLNEYTQQGYEFKVEGDRTLIICDGRFVGIVSNTSSLSNVKEILDSTSRTIQFAYDDTNHTMLTDFLSKIESHTGKKVESIVFDGGDSYKLVIDGEKVTIPYTASGSISIEDVTSRVEKKNTNSVNGNDLVSEDNIYDITEYLRNNTSGHEIEYKIIDGECYIIFDGTTYKVDSNTKISDVIYSFNGYLDTKTDTTPMAMQDTSTYYNKNYRQQQDYQSYRIDISEDAYKEIISNLKEIDGFITLAESQYDDSDITGKLRNYYDSLGVDNHSEFAKILNQSEDLQSKIDYSLKLYNSTDDNLMYFFNEMVSQIFAYDDFKNGITNDSLTYEQRMNNIESYINNLTSTYYKIYDTYSELYGKGVKLDRIKVNQMLKLFDALGLFEGSDYLNEYNHVQLYKDKDIYGNDLGYQENGNYQYLDANSWNIFLSACNKNNVISTIKSYINDDKNWEDSGMEQLFGKNLKDYWEARNGSSGLDAETIFLYRYLADKQYNSLFDSDVGIVFPDFIPEEKRIKDIDLSSTFNKLYWVDYWINIYKDSGKIEGKINKEGQWEELREDEIYDEDGNLIHLPDGERYITKYEDFYGDEEAHEMGNYGQFLLFVDDFFPEDMRQGYINLDDPIDEQIEAAEKLEKQRLYVIDYLQKTPLDELIKYNNNDRYELQEGQRDSKNDGHTPTELKYQYYPDINKRDWWIGNNEKLLNYYNRCDNNSLYWDDGTPDDYWFGRDYAFELTDTNNGKKVKEIIYDDIDLDYLKNGIKNHGDGGTYITIVDNNSYRNEMFYTGNEHKSNLKFPEGLYFYEIKDKEKVTNFVKSYIKSQDIFDTYDTLAEKTSECIAMQSNLSSLSNQIYNLNQYKKLMPYEELRKDSEFLKYLGTNFGTQSGDLAWLDQTELAIYYYLKSQNDKGDYHAGSVSNYIKALEDSLNQRKGFYYAAKYVEALNEGHKIADEYLGPLGDLADIFVARGDMMLSGTTGFASGVFNFGKGFYNLVAADGIRDATDYALLYQSVLMSSQNEYNENMPDWAREMYAMNIQVMSGVGNMMIPIALSIVPYAGPYLEKAAVFLSSMGNTTESAMQQGYSAGQAYLYGAVSATASLLSEWAFDRIPGLGNNSPNLGMLSGWDYAKALGTGMLREGTTESMQSYMEAGLKYFILGEPFEMTNITEEAFQAFILGALTSGVMTVGNSIIVKTRNGKKVTLSPEVLEEFRTNYGDSAAIVDIDNDGNCIVKTAKGDKFIVSPDDLNSPTFMKLLDSAIENVDGTIQFAKTMEQLVVAPVGSTREHVAQRGELKSIKYNEKSKSYEFTYDNGTTESVPFNKLSNEQKQAIFDGKYKASYERAQVVYDGDNEYSRSMTELQADSIELAKTLPYYSSDMDSHLQSYVLTQYSCEVDNVVYKQVKDNYANAGGEFKGVNKYHLDLDGSIVVDEISIERADGSVVSIPYTLEIDGDLIRSKASSEVSNNLIQVLSQNEQMIDNYGMNASFLMSALDTGLDTNDIVKNMPDQLKTDWQESLNTHYDLSTGEVDPNGDNIVVFQTQEALDKHSVKDAAGNPAKIGRETGQWMLSADSLKQALDASGKDVTTMSDVELSNFICELIAVPSGKYGSDVVMVTGNVDITTDNVSNNLAMGANSQYAAGGATASGGFEALSDGKMDVGHVYDLNGIRQVLINLGNKGGSV